MGVCVCGCVCGCVGGWVGGCVCVWVCVPEMEGIYATGGHPFQRLYLWWSLRTLYLLACELERLTSSVELAHATRVFVVVFVWRLNSER